MLRHVVVTAAGLLLAASPLCAQRIKLDQSVEELEAIAHADSNDAVAHYNAAIGYWSDERYDEAERSLTQAIELDRRFAMAYLARAYLVYARRPALWDEVAEGAVRGVWRDAVEASDRDYRQAFVVDPFVDLRILGAVVPRKSVYWDTDPVLSSAYNEWIRGFDDFREGNYEGAFLRFERLVEALIPGRRVLKWVPETILWNHALAGAHVERYEKAIASMSALYEQSLERESKKDLVYVPLEANDYRYVLALIHLRAGGTDEAFELLRRVAEEDLGNFMAHVHLAAIHEGRGELDQAIAERQRAVATNPGTTGVLLELAATLSKAGRLAEAKQALEEAVSINPRDPRAYYLLGLIQVGLYEYDGAKSSFTTFLGLAPRRLATWRDDATRRLGLLR